MHKILTATLIVMFVLMLGAVANAENQMGVADKYKVTFTEKILVADTLLPKGDYEITHVMEGSNHIMVFRQLGTKKPIEVRAKCALIPLGAKAETSQQIYAKNASNERVLEELIFKGDRAKHVF
jgi:hypothetical protein